MDIFGFWIFFVMFILISFLFLLLKRKSIETIVVHLIIMLVSIVIGVTQMIDLDATLTTVFLFIVVVSFIADVLMLEV